jgi:hypothetical protein
VRIDGALANKVWLPHVTAYVPALDAIEQVSVVTCERGRTAGDGGRKRHQRADQKRHQSSARVALRIPRQQPHQGESILPARRPGQAEVHRQPVRRFVGGPIRRNKLFYFGSWEGTYNRQTGASFATVPTAAIRSGNMSGSPNPIYDPSTGSADGSGRTAFPGNIIPANRQDPIAQMVGAAFPQPTYPDQLTNNVYATAPTP